jgi:hypothetical protein
MIAGLVAVANKFGAGRAAAEAQTQEPKQPPKDPQSSFEPKSGPGSGQKLMEQMVGNWDVVKTISPPGRDPMKTKGTCRQSMMHDGRFLRSEFTFEEKDGTKSTGLGVLGFDPKTETFTSVWTDSRSTRMSLRQSQDKFDGKAIVLYGRTLENGGTDAHRSHTHAALEDEGKTLVHRQFIAGPDGKDWVIMELRLTRKA